MDLYGQVQVIRPPLFRPIRYLRGLFSFLGCSCQISYYSSRLCVFIQLVITAPVVREYHREPAHCRRVSPAPAKVRRAARNGPTSFFANIKQAPAAQYSLATIRPRVGCRFRYTFFSQLIAFSLFYFTHPPSLCIFFSPSQPPIVPAFRGRTFGRFRLGSFPTFIR